MGFQPTRRIHRIEFDEGTVFAGLTLRCYGITVDEWVTGLTLKGMVEMLQERVVEWNWQDEDGQVVPLTKEGWGTLDMGDVYQLAREWTAAVTVRRADAPLERSSSEPDPAQGPDPEFEAAMPMELASSNASG